MALAGVNPALGVSVGYVPGSHPVHRASTNHNALLCYCGRVAKKNAGKGLGVGRYCFVLLGGGSGGSQVESSGPEANASIRAAITKSDSGCDLYLDQQSIDTTTPTGRLMFQVTGAFAEFERSMIRQRIHAGLKRAIEQGKQLGRPRIAPALEKRIQSHLRAGAGILKVARECGVGTGTVQRIKAEMRGPFDAVPA